jgi:prepilin-type N-terminal cleavage/methylation domain-containing protein
MRKRAGFSILELLAVLVIVALLLGLAVGAFGRYRANTALVHTSQRLAAEITNTQTLARTAGQVQVRAGVDLASTPPVATNADKLTRIEFRVVEGSPNGFRELKRMLASEGSTNPLRIQSTNLPLVPLAAGDTGLVLEIGENNGETGFFRPLITIPFNPDGTVILPLDTEPGRIILDNGTYKRRIEVSRVGKVKEERI